MNRRKIFNRAMLLIVFLITVQAGIHAQTVIEGYVLDTHGKAVDVYVTVSAKGTSNILGFADTDSKGNYKIGV